MSPCPFTPRYYDKPTMTDLYTALEATVRLCKEQGVVNLAMPRIGCDLDLLKWDEVRLALEEIFRDSGISVTVYTYKEHPKEVRRHLDPPEKEDKVEPDEEMKDGTGKRTRSEDQAGDTNRQETTLTTPDMFGERLGKVDAMIKKVTADQMDGEEKVTEEVKGALALTTEVRTLLAEKIRENEALCAALEQKAREIEGLRATLEPDEMVVRNMKILFADTMKEPTERVLDRIDKKEEELKRLIKETWRKKEDPEEVGMAATVKISGNQSESNDGTRSEMEDPEGTRNAAANELKRRRKMRKEEECLEKGREKKHTNAVKVIDVENMTEQELEDYRVKHKKHTHLGDNIRPGRLTNRRGEKWREENDNGGREDGNGGGRSREGRNGVRDGWRRGTGSRRESGHGHGYGNQSNGGWG